MPVKSGISDLEIPSFTMRKIFSLLGFGLVLQGDWEKRRRPDILDPEDLIFTKIAAAYCPAQDRLFGGLRPYPPRSVPRRWERSKYRQSRRRAERATLSATGEATWAISVSVDRGGGERAELSFSYEISHLTRSPQQD